jgi:branched-chain amino acid transport system substrate-binding protein
MKPYRNYPGMEGAVYYYAAFPKNPMNDWLVAEHQEALRRPAGLLYGGWDGGGFRSGDGDR